MSRRLLPTPEVLVLALAFWAGIGVVRDFDIWWHLAAGREIVATGAVPLADHWSHTVDGKPWFAHEWLCEVLFHGVWSAAGANGLLVWKALMGLATLIALSALYRLGDPEAGLGHLLALIAGVVCVQYHLLERPHLFTNLFLAVQVLLLERWRRAGPDRLWWLLPLYALWANLHGGVIIGLATFALYGAGLLFEDRARLRRLAIVSACCLAACLVNPRGVELLTYPLKYTGHGTLAADITEWTSPDFREYRPMEALCLALLALLLAARYGAGALELLLVLAGMHLFLQSKRNIIFVALFVLPVAADRLARLTSATSFSRAISRAGGGGWPLLACFVAAVSVHVAWFQPERIPAGYYPVGAVRFLEQNPQDGPMLNEFTYGGYFIWRLDPRYKVFIDSRTDMYFDEHVFAEYLAVFKLAMGWKEVLEKHRIAWAVFDSGHPLSTVLAETGEWREIYSDPLTTIWRKNP